MYKNLSKYDCSKLGNPHMGAMNCQIFGPCEGEMQMEIQPDDKSPVQQVQKSTS